MKDMEVKAGVSYYEDDFMSFTTLQPIAIDCTPLQWWCRLEQRQRYPRLSRIAIAIYPIPRESSEAERTCPWDRLRITCAHIEMVECVGTWLRDWHILPISRGRLGLPMVPLLNEDTVDRDNDLADIDQV
jgi:hypothetical protein